MSAFATAGLIAVMVKRFFMLRLAEGAGPHTEADISRLWTIDRILLMFLPVIVIFGFVLCFCGRFIRRGSYWARRAAQLTAVLGYIWVAAYLFACRSALSAQAGMPIPETEVERGILEAARIGSYFLLFAIPTFLLIILADNRPSGIGSTINAKE
jgi:hypothetical protein